MYYWLVVIWRMFGSRCLLFEVGCLWHVVCYVLFVVCGVLKDCRCSLVVGCGLLFWCLRYAVRGSLLVVSSFFYICLCACCLLIAVCGLLIIVYVLEYYCVLLFVVCCWLIPPRVCCCLLLGVRCVLRGILYLVCDCSLVFC